jgi:thiamine biosynthesis protein ThiS
MIEILFNDERMQIALGTCLNELVASEVGIALACNGKVVPRVSWESHLLQDGDRIDCLYAIQGG